MKSDRLFEILLYLIDKKDVTALELAKKFNVSVRTIYRDIDSLTNANIPIYTTLGNQGGIHLMENYVLNKTLLTSAEKADILFALKAFRNLPNISIDSALTKITPLFKVADSTDQWLEINFSRWGGNDIFDDTLFQTLKNCILQKERIQISYANEKGEFSERTVEPLKLVFRFNNWYLRAFCLSRNDYRLFKLKRIASIKRTNCHCEHLEERIIGDNDFAKNDKETINFVAIFPMDVAHYVYDIFSPNDVEILGNSKLKVTADVSDTEWFHSFLMFFGANIKILEPPELTEIIRQKHLAAAQIDSQ